MSAVALGKGVAGFVLGALLSIVVPPLAFAMALVLGGIVLWARWRKQDVEPLTPIAAGFLVAVLAYLALAVIAAARA